jgi:hypothetical protein
MRVVFATAVAGLVCAVVAGSGGIAVSAASVRTNVVTATTGTTPPLMTAIFDPAFQTGQRNQAFAMTARAGATYARVSTSWRLVARTPDPSTWDWSVLDATVSSALAHGISPILDIVGTPAWAYHVQPGNGTGGQPDVTMLGQFAAALAARYPVVKAFSVYNEMNFHKNFYPQDPTYYRRMVNAVADSVHAADPSALVAAGELAPLKHASGGPLPNTAPLTWMHKMLCISAKAPYHLTCPAGSSHFDVWTHHPYSDNGPYGRATAVGGVELGDLPAMEALLQAAWKLGAISSADDPSQRFPLWVTEVGWSSNPPNPHGVPVALEMRWVGEAMYQLWKSGATLGTWFLLQDMPLDKPFQSGLYTFSPSLASAAKKRLLTPFRMPFVAYLKPGGKVFVWGRDAGSDAQSVEVDLRIRGKWTEVASVAANAYGIFEAKLPVKALAGYAARASAGGVTSITFSLTVPQNENMSIRPFPLP